MEEKTNVSIKQIAALAHVSPSTASLVLNERGDEVRIAPDTQARIKKIAWELNYHPKVRQKRAAPKPKVIGVFWPSDLDKGPMTPFFTGARRWIKESVQGYELMMVVYDKGNLAEKAYLLEENCCFSGAIIMGLSANDATFLRDFQSGIPTVVFNRDVRGYHGVIIDDYEVGQFACTHFLRRGRKRLCVVSPNYASKSLSLRVVGYVNRAKELLGNGYSVKSIQVDNSDEGGYAAAMELVAQVPRPDAAFVTNDRMINGFVKGLLHAGLKIARDIEVISFGNSMGNLWTVPSVTSFDYPVEEMARESMQILKAAIDGTLKAPVIRNFSVSCIFRDSSPAVEESAAATAG